MARVNVNILGISELKWTAWVTLTQMTIISITVGRISLEEMEENNSMGKTRDFFKKIRHAKGTFHAKMGSIKDRNGMDLTEAEDIKKRWQEYTEELYKKRSSRPR